MTREYKILLAASFLCNFADNLFGPFYAVFVQKIGGSILTIGYAHTLTLVSTGILIIVAGKLSDSFNKEWVTICGYSLYALGSLGYLFISHPWQLFLLSIVFALGTACLSSPLKTLISHAINKKNEGLQWALAGGGERIILGLSVLIGTMIVKYSGFKILFIIMFILQIIVVLIQLQLVLKKQLKVKISNDK